MFQLPTTVYLKVPTTPICTPIGCLLQGGVRVMIVLWVVPLASQGSHTSESLHGAD